MAFPGESSHRSVESTLTLLARARLGDASAVEILLERYRPRLARWARGRLPQKARSLADTDDLVQDALIGTVRQLGDFQPANEASFLHYLRNALRNRVTDELRRARRRPETTDLSAMAEPAGADTPLDSLIEREQLDRYEAALALLTAPDREAIVARFEFGLTHAELAAALGKRTPDAARKATGTAVRRLLALMRDVRADGRPPRDVE